MYAEFLHYSGLAPVAVSNATDALTFAPEADVIVTGINLDGHVDGVELVSRLRGADSTMHKPIIVLTTCAWPQEQERAEHAGCDLFLSKPCLPDALLREVRLLLPTMHAHLEGGRRCHNNAAYGEWGHRRASGAITCRPEARA